MNYEAEGREGQYWKALGLAPSEGSWKARRLPRLPPAGLGLEDVHGAADVPPPLPWEGERGGDSRLRHLVPWLAPHCTTKSGALRAEFFGVIATHVPSRTGLECYYRWCQLVREGETEQRGAEARAPLPGTRAPTRRKAPPDNWQWLFEGDTIEVEVAHPQIMDEVAWIKAKVLTVLADGTFQARIVLPDGSDQWEDWFSWQEEGTDWRRPAEAEASTTASGGEEGSSEEGGGGFSLDRLLPAAGACFCGTKRHLPSSGLHWNGVWLTCDGCGRRVHGDCASIDCEPSAGAAPYRCPDCPVGSGGGAAKRSVKVPVSLTAMTGRHGLALGERILVEYAGVVARLHGEWFGGWVAAVYEDGTCDVHYLDGDKEGRVPRNRVRIFVCAETAERAMAREAIREQAAAAKAAAAAERSALKEAAKEAAAAARAAAKAERDAAKAAMKEAVRQTREAEAMASAKWVVLAELLPSWKLEGKRIQPGDRVQGKYQGQIGGLNWFDGVVRAVHEDGTCDLHYDDGDFEERVGPRWIKVTATGAEQAAAKAERAAQQAAAAEACNPTVAKGTGKGTSKRPAAKSETSDVPNDDAALKRLRSQATVGSGGSSSSSPASEINQVTVGACSLV